MNDIEEVKKNIGMCQAYMNLYNHRKTEVDKEIEVIIYNMCIEVRNGYGTKYAQDNKDITINNHLIGMIKNKEFTKEKYDLYYMSFTDYMFKYGTEYL